MSTASEDSLAEMLRLQLRNQVRPSDGNKLISVVTGDLWHDAPPVGVTWPYGVLRLYGFGARQGYYQQRETGVCELMLYTRPRTETTIKALRLASDLAKYALLQYRNSDTGAQTNGLVLVRGGTWDTLPPSGGAPVDEQVYAKRLAWTVIVWPRYLTQLTTP